MPILLCVMIEHWKIRYGGHRILPFIADIRCLYISSYSLMVCGDGINDYYWDMHISRGRRLCFLVRCLVREVYLSWPFGFLILSLRASGYQRGFSLSPKSSVWGIPTHMILGMILVPG